MFGFLDGRTNKHSKKNFENSAKVLEDVYNKNVNKPYSFGWINTTCHENFSNVFNVNAEQTPTLVVYIPSIDSYTTLFGSFNVENIDNFIDKVIHGKTSLYKVDREKVIIPTVKCEKIVEYTENLEEDEVLKEYLDDQKRKKEEEQRERKRLEENMEYKKSNKKKKSDL